MLTHNRKGAFPLFISHEKQKMKEYFNTDVVRGLYDSTKDIDKMRGQTKRAAEGYEMVHIFIIDSIFSPMDLMDG
jgi:hypothetical protein